MADKSFILTVVAVLAVAVLAGGLRNSYSGAPTFSSRVGSLYGATSEDRGYIPSYQRAGIRETTLNPVAVACEEIEANLRAQYCPGPRCFSVSNTAENCQEDPYKYGLA